MKRTKRMAQIRNGHTFIERRVFEDEHGMWYVRINGDFCSIVDLEQVCGYEIEIWRD